MPDLLGAPRRAAPDVQVSVPFPGRLAHRGDAAPLPDPPRFAPRLQLDFLDAIRGLVALYVVAHHSLQEMTESFDGAALRLLRFPAFQLLHYGHYAVVAFIVISGFSLMLPVARSGGDRLTGGVGGYLRRRCRRILPPYYAALCLSLLTILAVPSMRHVTHMRWDVALPALRLDVVASHLLLVHNFSPSWIYKINGAMWSIATEWQAYFFFPLVLIPVWRRFGNVTVVVVGWAAGVAILRGTGEQLGLACPWFLGAFAMGMVTAELAFGARAATVARRLRLTDHLPWGRLTLALGALVALLHAAAPRVAQHAEAMDVLVGLMASCAILFCCRRATAPAARGRLLGWLEARPLVFLGGFSYSLYLVHPLVPPVLHLLLLKLHASPTVTFATLMTGGIALAVGVAYAFHLAFERPFMTTSRTGARDVRPPMRRAGGEHPGRVAPARVGGRRFFRLPVPRTVRRATLAWRESARRWQRRPRAVTTSTAGPR